MGLIVAKAVKGQVYFLAKTAKDVPDISKSQRYANRPPLEKIFSEGILRDKSKVAGSLVPPVECLGIDAVGETRR